MAERWLSSSSESGSHITGTQLLCDSFSPGAIVTEAVATTPFF